MSDHSHLCNGSMEIHTMHLVDRPGHYQIVYRCGCNVGKRLGRRIYSSLADAELAIKKYPIEQLLRKRL